MQLVQGGPRAFSSHPIKLKMFFSAQDLDRRVLPVLKGRGKLGTPDQHRSVRMKLSTTGSVRRCCLQTTSHPALTCTRLPPTPTATPAPATTRLSPTTASPATTTGEVAHNGTQRHGRAQGWRAKQPGSARGRTQLTVSRGRCKKAAGGRYTIEATCSAWLSQARQWGPCCRCQPK